MVGVLGVGLFYRYHYPSVLSGDVHKAVTVSVLPS